MGSPELRVGLVKESCVVGSEKKPHHSFIYLAFSFLIILFPSDNNRAYTTNIYVKRHRLEDKVLALQQGSDGAQECEVLLPSRSGGSLKTNHQEPIS